MSTRWRDWVAAAVAVLALTLGILTLAIGRFDPIIHVEPSNDGRIVVTDVQADSFAWEAGLRPGMIVQALNSVTLIQLPQYIYPAVEPTPDPLTGDIPTMAPIGSEPALPTNVPMSDIAIDALLAAPVSDISAIQPWDLDHGSPDSWMVVGFYDGSVDALRQTTAALFLGAGIMLVLGWWLASGRAGEALRPMAVPLAVATSVPFLVRPLTAVGSVPLMATAGILTVLAMVPLATDLIERVTDPGEQRLVTIVSAACAVAGAMLAIAVARPGPWPDSWFAQWALIGAIPLVPGFAAAGPILPRDRRIAAASSGRLLESTGFAVVGATPFFALASTTPPYVFPLGLWFAGIMVAGRITVRPLARLASRATLQRDLVVAATEAERARVAADIHDDALQELTLLVHRLDAAGDTEGADIARTVSDRLRAICGDLRLPILDDLGVGPALDWLVLRIERLAARQPADRGPVQHLGRCRVALDRRRGSRDRSRCRGNHGGDGALWPAQHAAAR
jgi:signal transduction histidine kinase